MQGSQENGRKLRWADVIGRSQRAGDEDEPGQRVAPQGQVAEESSLGSFLQSHGKLEGRIASVLLTVATLDSTEWGPSLPWESM